MYLFRRVTDKDADLPFLTGNQAFDDKCPDGTLKTYINEDLISGGEFLTYILIEQLGSDKESLLGLLRYKTSSREEFFSELNHCSIKQDIYSNLNNEMDRCEYKFIYLSRIGVVNQYQDKNVGQVISNFFEFLIKKIQKNQFIYLKVIEGKKNFIASSYNLIGYNDDQKWGNYYIASKFLYFR